MPQGPPGPLAVTFPDRLPYGESNVPDAFSCTRFPAAQWRGPLGLENEFHAQDTLHALLSSLTSKTAQSLQQTQEPPGIPALSCQVQSPPAPRISRWRAKREGEDLRGSTDLRLTTSTGTEKRKAKQLDYQASQMWGVNWPLSKGKGKLVKKHRSCFIKIYFNCKRSRQKNYDNVLLFVCFQFIIKIQTPNWKSFVEFSCRIQTQRSHLEKDPSAVSVSPRFSLRVRETRLQGAVIQWKNQPEVGDPFLCMNMSTLTSGACSPGHEAGATKAPRAVTKMDRCHGKKSPTFVEEVLTPFPLQQTHLCPSVS